MKLAFTILLMGIAQSQTLLNTLRNLGASDSSYENGTSTGTYLAAIDDDATNYKKAIQAKATDDVNEIQAKATEDVNEILAKAFEDMETIDVQAAAKKKAIYAKREINHPKSLQHETIDVQAAAKKKAIYAKREINQSKSLQQLLMQEPKGTLGFTPTEYVVKLFKKFGGLNYQKLVEDDIVEQPTKPSTIKLNFKRQYNYATQYFEFAQMNSDDQLHGFARYINNHGLVFEAEFRNGKIHGFERRIDSDNSYPSPSFTIYWQQNNKVEGYLYYSNDSNTPTSENQRSSMNARGKKAFTIIKLSGAADYFIKD